MLELEHAVTRLGADVLTCVVNHIKAYVKYVPWDPIGALAIVQIISCFDLN